MQLLVLFFELLVSWGQHQSHRGWFLCFGRNSQFHSAPYVDVRNSVLLAQHRNMTYDIHWGYISSQNTYAFFALPDCLYDVFDSSFEFLLAVEVASELQDLAPEYVISDGVCDRSQIELLVFCVHFNTKIIIKIQI